ncbi:hypothetical protein [Nocardia pseudovaccinii]|uniref:hypothetical protein n=1 Tax=Nocardia pseudovaccinii TaxID=189540 RepID=UPI000A81A352|nr:hypothetical protein [Nocardia pseudovaccinii]
MPWVDGIDEVLFDEPPLANACVRFPTQMELVADARPEEHQPVLISLVGCPAAPESESGNTDNRKANPTPPLQLPS